MKTKSSLMYLAISCLLLLPEFMGAQINNDGPFNSSGTDNSFSSTPSQTTDISSTTSSTGSTLNTSSTYGDNDGHDGHHHGDHNGNYFKCDKNHWHHKSLDDGHHHCPYQTNVPFDGGIGILLGIGALYGVKKSHDKRKKLIGSTHTD